jgi:thioester reductase-like protein
MGLWLNELGAGQVSDGVDVIINCAASIDWDMPLRKIMQINTFGPLGVLELARESRKKVCLVHMSSAYAATFTHTSGMVVPEALSDLPFDPVALIKDIEKMTDQEVEQGTPGWVGK